MFLADVIGHVVATKKDDSMQGKKLLLLRPQLVDETNPTQFRNGVNTIVAVDNIGAGEGDLVMFCQGSSARQAAGLKPLPVDAAIIAIVDTVDVLGQKIYQSS
ncbi:MAG: EutN/CcmL family microcompartment protein [Verrucomicrobiae bacterium]|nr:EutN/CcmL family microcompartment protein [Verrucomicrobiae bacterium]NNJ44181.1 EutN/CcmL family microcompartment protein [Akkermansiaceae bacterium]